MESSGDTVNEDRIENMKEKVVSWLENTLRVKGFEVKRSVRVEGSGISHAVNLLAEIDPLPDVKLSIGVIVLDKPLSIDEVEKFIGWKSELPLTKLVLVPLTDIDGVAYTLALKHGIDVVIPSEDFLSSIQATKAVYKEIVACKHIEPVIDFDSVYEKIRDKLKSSIFRRTQAKLEKLVLVFIPLTENLIEVAKIDGVGGGVEIVEGKTLFEALAGYSVRSRNGGIDIHEDYGSFADIPAEALEMLRALSEEPSIELGTLAGMLGMSIDRVKPLLQILAARGLIDLYGDLVEFKGINLDLFADIENIVSRHNAKIHEGEPSIGKGRLKIDVMISIPKIEEVLNSLRAKILNTRIIYYPFYVALLAENRNRAIYEKIVVIDGLSNEEAEGFTKIIANPKIIDAIRVNQGLEIGHEEKE